jgi:SAM-dependent methyltransferase
VDVSRRAAADGQLPDPGVADWAGLWRVLVEARLRCAGPASGPGSAAPDLWSSRADEYEQRVARRWSRPDSSRAFLLAQLGSGASVLDIGAGTGAWSRLLAARAARVTAVERSPGMIRVLRERLEAEGTANVSVVEGVWPDVRVEPHDYSLCANAMYWSADLVAFVSRMQACTEARCFLIMRSGSRDGIMARASVHLRGHPYDSPDATVALNVLREMGIAPAVLMETGGEREPRASASLAEAMDRMRRHFGVCDTTEHDPLFDELLRGALRRDGDRWLWPRDGGTALIHWSVA